MNELHNASGSVSTRASLWVLCTICILTLGLGYLSAALLPAATPPVELTQDLAAIAPSHAAAPIADASYAPSVASRPVPPTPVALSAPAAKTVSTTVTLAPAATAPAKAEKPDAPVLLAQATPSESLEQNKVASGLVLVPAKEQAEVEQVPAEQPFPKGIPFSDPAVPELLNFSPEGPNKNVKISTPVEINAIDAAPANDDCANAITLVQGTSCTNTAGTNVEATQSVAPIACGGFTSSSALDVWYKFVATTTSPTVQVVGGGTLDTILDVRSGACNGTNIGCSDATTSGGTEAVNLSGLTVGNTYLFRVYGWAGATGTFNTCVFQTPPPVNDTCTSPTALTLNVPASGTNVGAANDYTLAGTLATCFTNDGEIGQTSGNPVGRDTVWSFTAPAAGLYSFRAINTAAAGGGNLVVYTSTTCPAPGAITCSTSQKAANRNSNTAQFSAAEEVMCKSMTAGETRYVFVDELAATTTGGAYTIEVNPCTLDPDAGNAPATATVLSGSSTCGIEGTIISGTAPRDQDFFSLGAPTSGSRVFAIIDTVAGNSTDADMRVTNATDTLEYDNSDNATPWGSLGPNIGGRALTGVTSYLEATHTTSGSTLQPYRLYAVVQPPGAGLGSSSATAETEPNGTTLASANVAANNFFSGIVSPGGVSGDLDLFAFGANAGDLIQLNIDGDPLRNLTPTPFAVFLFDDVGNQLIGQTNGTSTSSNTASAGTLLGTTPNSPGEAATWRAAYSGTYYAGINTQSSASTGDYLYSIGINCLTGTQLTSDVTISKSGPPTGTAGANLVYTITVNNLGPNAANGVTWTDTFPSNTTFVGLTGPAGWTCQFIAGGLSCTDGGLGANVPQVFTLTLGVPQCYGNGTATNSVSITSLTTDTNPANNSASANSAISDPGTCTDNNPCTTDVCTGGTCVSTNLCEDNDACTTDLCDGQGGCSYTPVNCDDSNPCTDDSCNPATGCVHANNSAPCTDSNVCTLGDVCSGGSCVPGPLPPVVTLCNTGSILIPAGQPTTTSGIASPYPSTITATGQQPYLCSVTVDLKNVTHTFVADIDLLLAHGTPNAIIMSDVGGTTAVTGVNLTLDDVAANSLPGGTITSGTYKPTNITTGDTFTAPAPTPTGGSALSTFVGGNPNGAWDLWALDDGSSDVGSIGTGWCINIRAICQSNADCNDNNTCTDDACSGGVCTHTPNTGSSCTDGNACTTSDTCLNGTCTGTPTVCNDNDNCTDDSCNQSTGDCVFTPINCNDNNACTDDSCVNGPGCQHVNNNANSCSDNDHCTQTDTCVDGFCVGSNPVNCDDNNVCTTDSCSPSTGLCGHASNTNPCDDGNACTSGDACSPGASSITLATEAFDGVTAPALPAGWSSTQTGTGSLWVTSITTPDTAPNSALGADGTTVSDELLVSPPIAITSAVSKVTFKNRWTFENSGASCFDAGVLEIKIGAGSFTDIVTAGGSFASGGYTGTVSTGFSNPLGGRSAWCAVSTSYPAYLTTIVNLPASAAGQTIQLRWRIGTDSSTGAAGQNIDSVVITENPSVCHGTTANCDDGNACTADTCDSITGCHQEGITCDDGNACTTDTCNPSTGCVYTPISCDDGNVCTDDSCNPETGCVNSPNTSPCSDGNACTTGDVCSDGDCMPGTGTLVCNDSNICTDDSCDPSTGCVYTPNTAPCSDNNACTTGDICNNSACQPGGPTNCDDGNACTLDGCDSVTGCTHTAITCNDNDACTTDTCNPATGCVYTPISCDDGNVCTDDACNPSTGCVYTNNTEPCSDNNACTGPDVCAEGQCQPGPGVICDDGNACTADTCDAENGCLFAPVDCNDHNPCTDDSCNPSTGCVYSNNTEPCNDNDACTTNDTCGGGTCHGGPAVVCNDGNVCTTDSCNPLSGCVYAPNTNPCDDGDACTTGDTCGGGICNPGGPTNCNDNNPCTDDSCVSPSGCQHVDNADPCDDGNACTTNDACSGGSCVGGAPPNCNDNNVCTDDACNPATGCTHADNTGPCDDGNACTTGDICGEGTCHAGAPASCDDGNACTVDGCNPATGCTHVALSCDDGNVCTVDNCNPATGCTYVPVLCDDGNACTSDACVPVIGCVYTPITCNDNNVCTDDTCNPGTGCVYTPNHASCDDGNACTVDVCSNGSCGCPPVQACTPTSAHFDSTEVPKAISTSGTPTVTSTVTVSGVGTYLRDLNVKTFITHTSTGQLQITIKSPAGTIVTLSSNNGAALDNLFNGTLWDDQADPGNQAPFPGDTFAASNLVGDTVYADLTPKATLVPEEPLSAFLGENPNGVWTLTIADQTAGDGGNLANWSVDVATLAAAPPTRLTASYASTDVPKAIPTTAPPTVVTSNVTVAGAGSQIGRVRLTTFITHTFPGDIDMTLKSPSGRIVTVTSDNAGTNDNAFNGTLWDAKADPGNQVPYVVPLAASKIPSDTTYAVNVVKTTLTPEESLDAFIGENPNGVWTLTISDDANLDGGSLVNWSLEITTDDCTQPCAVNCDDGNPCTDDACDPATGCYHTNNTGSCNDGNACTTADTCGGGECHGTPVNCSDGNVCTDDSCNPANGLCVHANNTGSCDDGNACTTGDVCGTPATCGTGENFDGVTAPALPAGWTSSQTGTGSLWVTSAASSSSAPNSALGADGATVSDELLISPPIAINSATAQLTFRNRWSFESASSCFDAGVLEIKIGAGSFTDIVTAGGSFVTGGYTGTVSSSFSNPLGGRSAWCNASTGYPAYTTTTVNLPASAAGQTIQLRWRIGTDTSTGAAGQNIDSIAISDVCANVCHGGGPTNCDDGNVCTDDACNPATGCTHTNNTAPCDDGNACTAGDTCGGGNCQPGGPVTIPEVTNVLVDAGSVITWTAIPGAVYDIASGSTNDMLVNGVVNATCLANDVAVATYTDVQPGPVQDDGFFYLIRAQTACGSGNYGTDSGGAPRTPTSACP